MRLYRGVSFRAGAWGTDTVKFGREGVPSGMSNFRLHSSDLSRAPQRKLKILEAKDDHTLKHVDAIRGRVTFQQNCNPPSRAVHLRGIL